MTQSMQRQGGKLIHPRLPDELYEAVAEYATANSRSVTNAVVYLVRQGLAAEQRSAGEGAEQ